MRKNFSNPLIFILLASLALNFFLILKNKKITLSKASSSEQTKAVKIIDGDTFDIENGTRVRLIEINAPEFPKGCLADDSRQRL
jgi:endonuclease YncB( thermonuclease family)